MDETIRRKERSARLGHIVQQLAGSRDGRYFLRWIMAECGVFEQTFPRDETLAVWNAGRRAFGLQVLELCAAGRCAATLWENREEDNGRDA